MITLECHGCGTSFEIQNKDYNNRKKRGNQHFFCSQKCVHGWQSQHFKKQRMPQIKKIKEQLPDGTKRCSSCKNVLPVEDFGFREEKRLQSLCKSCLYIYQMKRWNAKKLAAIQYLGIRCHKCGEKFHPATMDFHHRNGEDKEFNWYKLRLRKWDNIIAELDKCDLLCANCHRLEHVRDEFWEGLDPLKNKYIENVAPHLRVERSG